MSMNALALWIGIFGIYALGVGAERGFTRLLGPDVDNSPWWVWIGIGICSLLTVAAIVT